MGSRFDQSPEVYIQDGGPEVDERKTDGSLLAEEQQHPWQQPDKAKNRNPFGLGAATFGLLVALVTLVTVGAGLGGGLGGALASAHKKESITTVTRTITTTVSAATPLSTTATASPTSTLYTNVTVPDPRQVGTLFLNCPNLNNTAYSSSNSQAFTFTCGITYPGGLDNYSGGKIATLGGLVAYTPEDCAVACSTFNMYSNKFGNGTVCAAITFRASLSSWFGGVGANCWLFDSTGPPELSSDAISAVLQ